MTHPADPAPQDPRQGWDLPPLGRLPLFERHDEITSRVLAPNASHMTLDGTNTYVLGHPGSGCALVVDPGPDDDSHLANVERALADIDAACELIVVTHGHLDHSEAAAKWARLFGCGVAAAAPLCRDVKAVVIEEGLRLAAGGISLEVIETPGHCADHIALRLPTGAVLCGDQVLGRGTSVVAWPEGDLVAYLESLRKLMDLGPEALFPGHGPALTQDPSAVLSYYAEHRAFRERQVLQSLARGPASVEDLVRDIYCDVDRVLWHAAGLSTRAALEKLVRERKVSEVGAGQFALLR